MAEDRLVTDPRHEAAPEEPREVLPDGVSTGDARTRAEAPRQAAARRAEADAARAGTAPLGSAPAAPERTVPTVTGAFTPLNQMPASPSLRQRSPGAPHGFNSALNACRAPFASR